MNIVCFGAHPDDAEFYAGGTMVKWARRGHRVLAVSLTNGDIGHHEITGEALAARRAEETKRAAALGGYDCRILDHHDGALLNTLELRREVAGIIREAEADLVLSHRPYDYHPDHRYTAMAVQDAAFMVTVPGFCPEVPALRHNPAFMYMMDGFTRPVPFQPDIVVAVDDVMDVKWAMLDAMESQVYEWLPWLEGKLAQVPEDPAARWDFMVTMWEPWFRAAGGQARKILESHYGARRAARIRYTESFELCEYGHRPGPEALRSLFPVPAED